MDTPDHETRLMLSETSGAGSKAVAITRAIEMLLGAYRKSDYHEPDIFVLQLGIVFESYDISVIEFVTSPRTGLQRTCKFPPSIAEVVEACDGYLKRKEMEAWLAANPQPTPACLMPQIKRGSEQAIAWEKYLSRAIPWGEAGVWMVETEWPPN